MANMVERQRAKRRRTRLEVTRQLNAMKDDDVLEEKARTKMASMLIARRIVLDISDETLVERLGHYQVTTALKDMEAGDERDIKVYREARRIERDLLTDGRLSTFQRYARVVGLRFDVGIEPNEAARQRRRWQRAPMRLSRRIRSQRHYLATKYGKVRARKSYF